MKEKNAFDKRQFYNNDDSSKTFIFALLLPYILSFVVATIISGIAGGDEDKLALISNSPAFLICAGLIAPIAFALIYFLYAKAFKISFKASTIANKPKWQDVLLSIFVAIVALLGFYMLINCQDELLRAIKYPLDETFKLLPMDNAGWLLLYIFVFALLPAICEEFVFRGVVLQGFAKNFSDKTAIVMSALLFMLMHGRIEQVIYPFLFGLVLGWIALRSGSLICSMIVHFVNNAIVVLLAYLEYCPSIKYKFLPFQNVWWYYLLAFGLVAVTGVIIFLLDKLVFKHKCRRPLEKERVQKPSAFLWVGIAVAVVLIVVGAVTNFLSPS